MRSLVKYYTIVAVALVPLISGVVVGSYAVLIDDSPAVKSQMLRSDDYGVAISSAEQAMTVQREGHEDGGKCPPTFWCDR
jgi:hypothetical protein